MKHRRVSAPLVALALVGGAISAARAQAPDPFAQQRRWWHTATVSDAWMPASIDFAAEGELVWSSASGVGPRVMLHGSGELVASSSVDPVRQDSAFAGSTGTVLVRGAASGRALFALAQYVQTGSQRSTEITRREPDGALAFQPSWRRTLTLVGNGGARLAVARDGARVVAAAHDAATSALDVEWLDGNTGAVSSSTVLTSSTLRELCASSDVARVAVVAGAHVWLLETHGPPLFEQDLGQATNAVALAGDGRTLAFGWGPRVRVLADQAGSFQPTQDVWGAFGELPVRVALSDDGDTLAIAWWNQTTGTAVRFEVWRAGALAFEHSESHTGGFQNYPTTAQLTPDGSRALFAAWGQPSAAPEAWLVDVDAGVLAWSLDLPGSALAAALDDSGTRIALGIKHAHANQFASTGELRLYDTGARDLQIVGTPSLANGLHLATRLPGAQRAFFVLGHRLAAPVPFPGASGLLAIDRANGGRIFARASDASGRADLQLALPLSSLGVDFAAQAAFRVAGQLRLTTSVVAPVTF